MTSETLVTWARRLNAGRPGRRGLPALWFVTDETRCLDPSAAIARLPRESGVIFRHYRDPARTTRAAALARLCRSRGLVFLVAGDPVLARRVRADGLHWPEAAARRQLRGNRAGWSVVTVAAHSLAALRRARAAGADAVLLSPVFPTRSPSGRAPLGPVRFAALLRQARGVPVYALGGVDDRTVRRLAGTGAAGLAAHDALLDALLDRQTGHRAAG